MSAMASQITDVSIVYQLLDQAQIKENIKAPCHWPLCGEFTGEQQIPAQRASNAEIFPFDDVIMSNVPSSNLKYLLTDQAFCCKLISVILIDYGPEKSTFILQQATFSDAFSVNRYCCIFYSMDSEIYH